MSGNDFRIGILTSNGYLHTNSGAILLTRISIQAANSPKSELLTIDPADVGKMALVRGNMSGEVLYSAELVEIIPPLTGGLMETLISKGNVSYEEIQDTLSESSKSGPGNSDQRKLCALVIGHKKASPGSRNERKDLTEFEFNDRLASRIEKKVRTVDIQRVYRRTYKELPDDINDLNPHFIISLHCNAFNEKVSGTEVLYYHKSERGKHISEILLGYLVRHLKLPDRGVKGRTAEDRGGFLLRYTKSPCVIAEPFFLDNDKDLARAQKNLNGLATAYVNAIKEVAQFI